MFYIESLLNSKFEAAEIKSNVGEVTKDVEKLDKATKKGATGFKGIGKAVKGMGLAL